MAETNIVKVDQGGVNARILAKETKADFRRVEGASLKIRTSFASAEGKRMFVRYYSTFQLALHFISVIARTRLDGATVAKGEAKVREHMAMVSELLNAALDDAEVQFRAHGITSAATYDTVPLQLDVGVLSSSGRRYLDILVKLDQLMPLLQTLEIHEVMGTQEVDRQRAAMKRKVREVANGARGVATHLRAEMDALAGRMAARSQPQARPAAAIAEAAPAVLDIVERVPEAAALVEALTSQVAQSDAPPPSAAEMPAAAAQH